MLFDSLIWLLDLLNLDTKDINKFYEKEEEKKPSILNQLQMKKKKKDFCYLLELQHVYLFYFNLSNYNLISF